MALSTRKVEGDETIHFNPPRKQRPKPKADMQPPLTPMIDVTFQLLLFFLLTCEFRESEGMIPGTLPAKGNFTQVTSDTPPLEPITIKPRASIDRKSAGYEMTGIPTVLDGPQKLFDALMARKAALGSDEVPVVILPGNDVPWEFVVEAFNQAVRAQYKKIGFGQEIFSGGLG